MFIRTTEPHVVLASLAGGGTIQVGNAAPESGTFALYDVLDRDLTGWHRDRHGALRRGEGRPHSIHGEPVGCYRVRQASAIKLSQEFGRIEQVPVGHVRKGR